MVDVQVFWNFRSPYCYLASHKMWVIEDEHDARFVWRPLSGWDGRSPPDRAKKKLPISRQDVQRWCRRMGIAFVPPPKTTDPTPAAMGSLLAVAQGRMRPYVTAVMAREWSHGGDIGDLDVLVSLAEEVGLDRHAFLAAIEDPSHRTQLAHHKELADARGIFGVPTFLIGDQVFWGQDRIDFVTEHLAELGA